MTQLELGGRTFRDVESYNMAKRDLIKIDKIKDSLDMTNIASIKEALHDIDNRKIRFESLLGDDFTEELEETLKALEKENVSPKVTKKNSYRNTKEDNRDVKTVTDDALLQKEIQKRVKRNELKRKLLIISLGLVMAGCVGYLIFYFVMYAKNDAEYNALSELINDNPQSEKEYSVTIVSEDKDTPPILSKYETLYQKNHKIVGWLKIEGTNIDYPVMQTINNEYYLDHNYNQDYDKNGSIFMDKDCDAAHPNDNMIIYGHHMKSGKMFGQLNYYAKESFYKEHPSFMFDTIYEEGTYDVMYVFRSRIYNEEEVVFKYYKFLDATSEAEFNSNMEEMSALSLYDTGVRAKYGDRLITLSTCDSSESNGRFVVVAKKVK